MSELPPAAEWNAAVQHSRDFPTHILGPYEGPDGVTHMDCTGSTDPLEPSCGFDTDPASALAHDDRCGAVTGGGCDCREWERFDEDRAERDRDNETCDCYLDGSACWCDMEVPS